FAFESKKQTKDSQDKSSVLAQEAHESIRPVKISVTKDLLPGDLITIKEAQLPNAKGELKTRGISRGPGIKVISPDVNIAEVKAEIRTPFDLKVAFEPRGGVKIDPNSVKITYLKFPYIDLTDRLKPGISESGIDFPKANVPSGEHSVRINVKDIDGRESSLVVTLIAIK
ncbi:MAG: hypothetical protein EBX86_07040, partial [Actinobacteria bacterium]|nr:hypothetical protein [Actinomycetota bacterium]